MDEHLHMPDPTVAAGHLVEVAEALRLDPARRHLVAQQRRRGGVATAP